MLPGVRCATGEAGDHGGEHVVRVIDEVFAGEDCDEVLVAVEIGGGQGEEFGGVVGLRGIARRLLRGLAAREAVC